MRTQIKYILLALVSCVILSCDGRFNAMTGGNNGGVVDNLPAGPGGCIQGSVYNGLSGEHIPLPNGDYKQGVHILAGRSIIPAQPRIKNAMAPELNTSLSGDFIACGIPLDMPLPIFVWMDNFLAFESRIEIDSTKQPKATQATADIPLNGPIESVNVRLYPIGTQTKDLRFSVTHAGMPLAGANVQIRPTGANYLDLMDSSNFLSPVDARMQTISLATDASGIALFPAEELILGGKYRYVVLPPLTGPDNLAASDNTGSFIVGVRASVGSTDPYLVNVNLSHAQPALALVSSSTDSNDYNPRGALTLVFNRAIEIVPGSLDGITASLTGANGAKLVVNQPSNTVSEQVKIEKISGNSLTVVPVFEQDAISQPNPYREPGLKVTFAGINVRPAGSPATATPLAVASTTVSFFGGNVETPAAKYLVVESGDAQTGKVGSPLPDIILVKVLDQFNNPMEGQNITFTTTGTDGGKVRKDDVGGTGATSTTITTDFEGKAKLVWYMGYTTGSKVLIASAAGVDPLVISATAQP